MVDTKIKNGVDIICAKTGIFLTDEQANVAYNFDKSMAVFANPGTGKTTTAIVGLLTAQVLYGIPGKKINAMSFTRLSTGELAGRYQTACKRCGLSPTVNFNTFHSICYKIIKKKYPNKKYPLKPITK